MDETDGIYCWGCGAPVHESKQVKEMQAQLTAAQAEVMRVTRIANDACLADMKTMGELRAEIERLKQRLIDAGEKSCSCNCVIGTDNSGRYCSTCGGSLYQATIREERDQLKFQLESTREASVAAVKNLHEQLEAAQRENEEIKEPYRKVIAPLRKERDELAAQYKTSGEAIQLLGQKVRELKAELSAAQAEIDRLQQYNDAAKLAEQNAALTKERDEVRTQLANVGADWCKTKQEVVALKELAKELAACLQDAVGGGFGNGINEALAKYEKLIQPKGGADDSKD